MVGMKFESVRCAWEVKESIFRRIYDMYSHQFVGSSSESSYSHQHFPSPFVMGNTTFGSAAHTYSYPQTELGKTIAHIGGSTQRPQQVMHMPGKYRNDAAFSNGGSGRSVARVNPGRPPRRIWGTTKSNELAHYPPFVGPVVMASAPCTPVVIPLKMDRCQYTFASACAVDVPAHLDNGLLSAALAGNENSIQQLLKMGANIESRDASGRTPLMQAIVSGSEKAVTWLLRASANIVATDAFGNTPLIYAAKMDDVKTIDALRAVLIDVDARNTDGDTALICAINQNKLKAVQALLKEREYRVDPEYYVGGRKYFSAEQKCSVRANPASKNKYGVVPLIFAIRARIQMNPLASEKRRLALASPDENSKMQKSIAINFAIIEALLAAGADVDSTDIGGNTLQSYAAMMEDKKLVDMLHSFGANPLLKNILNRSARDYAHSKGADSLVKVLSRRV